MDAVRPSRVKEGMSARSWVHVGDVGGMGADGRRPAQAGYQGRMPGVFGRMREANRETLLTFERVC